jgi:hypothetical protein
MCVGKVESSIFTWATTTTRGSIVIRERSVDDSWRHHRQDTAGQTACYEARKAGFKEMDERKADKWIEERGSRAEETTQKKRRGMRENRGRERAGDARSTDDRGEEGGDRGGKERDNGEGEREERKRKNR